MMTMMMMMTNFRVLGIVQSLEVEDERKKRDGG